jgi:3-oxoacyl-[acyl-carrier-protein] synthase II
MPGFGGPDDDQLLPFFVRGMPAPPRQPVMGEGSGIFVLERTRDARSRGANIYAEIASCSVGADCGHPTLFAEDGSSIARVLSRALKQAGLPSSGLHYLNAHGTGTLPNDRIETRAFKTVLGPDAGALSISSTKAATGHLLGASGSVEAAFACLALRDQFVPPTVHLEQPDRECDLDYTPRRGRSRNIEAAASLSYGFGGPIGAVVFRRP